MIKKILIILVVVAALIGGYFYYQNYKNSKTTPVGGGTNVVESFTGQGVTVANQNSSLNVVYVDPLKSDFGVAIYPGATPYVGGSGSTSTSSSNTGAAGKMTLNGQNLLVGSFVSTASLSNVVNFYKKQMGSTAKTSSYISGGKSYQMISSTNAKNPVIKAYSQDNQTYFTITKPL